MSSKSAEKLFTKMTASKSGWGADDLDALYTGFGFEKKEGRRHALYMHPRFPGLVATVARHRDLATGYVQHAVKLIQLVKVMEGGGHET